MQIRSYNGRPGAGPLAACASPLALLHSKTPAVESVWMRTGACSGGTRRGERCGSGS